VDPFKHVGIIVDSAFSASNDPGGGDILDGENEGGMGCTPAPLIADESDSVAVLRLSCINATQRTL
jgi:hypothetical protein